MRRPSCAPRRPHARCGLRQARARRSARASQVLKGATGTGKTFVLAHAIEALDKPTLVLAPNKVLAAQLYAELRDFFPDAAVKFFVSHFDYYRPESYRLASDT